MAARILLNNLSERLAGIPRAADDAYVHRIAFADMRRVLVHLNNRRTLWVELAKRKITAE